MNTAALAGLRGVTHQSMRLVVEQLDETGLITRTADLRDRRSQSMVITEAGRRHLERFQEARASLISDLIGRTLTIEERRTLGHAVGLLDRLSEAGR